MDYIYFGRNNTLMAVVRGHFATILHPGLRQIWAGVYFGQVGLLYLPRGMSKSAHVSTGPGGSYQTLRFHVANLPDEWGNIGPDPDDFDDYDDYLIAQAECQYDALH